MYCKILVAKDAITERMNDVVQRSLEPMGFKGIKLNLLEYEQCCFHRHCLHKMTFRANDDILLFVDFSYDRLEGKKLDFAWDTPNYWDKGSHIKQDIPGADRPFTDWPSDINLTNLENNQVFERIMSSSDTALTPPVSNFGTLMTFLINRLKAMNCDLCKEFSTMV